MKRPSSQFKDAIGPFLLLLAAGVAQAQVPGFSRYPEMIFIPGGEFQMGDHAGFVDPQHPSDELPIHTVQVDSFYMGKYHVTNVQYVQFLNSANVQGLIEVRAGIVYRKGSSDAYCETREAAEYSSIAWDGKTFTLAGSRGNHPVVGMRWFGAAAYTNWLSAQLGFQPCYDTTTWKCDFSRNGYRLPTEAEWEYAGRGGQYSPYYVYPWGNDADAARANWPLAPANPYQTGPYPWTTPVGFFNGQLRGRAEFDWPGAQSVYQTRDGSNAYGLHDMAGNAWQLVHDWYQTNYYSASPSRNPTGPDSGSPMPDGLAYRGMRGGNWYNGDQTDPGHARVSNRNPSYYRGPQDPNHPYYHIGFRVARRAPAPTTLARLPGTGQTGNFTATFGEDSDYPLNGPTLAANGDGTVADMITGLVWQQADGGEMAWESAKSYCGALASGGLHGWRLPFAHELFSILSHDTVNPALPGVFTRSSAEYWWSADQRADDASRVWVTNAGGGIGPHAKTETVSAGGSKKFHARCVRSSIPVDSLHGSFTDNGDGTVTDTHTGLMWQKADSGNALKWEEALRYSEGLSLAGYDDWRLPNIKELESISDQHMTNPSLDKSYFAGTLPAENWSSTTLVNQTAAAWTVDFTFGIASYRPKTEALRVRSVRGGLAGLTMVSAASFESNAPLAAQSIGSAFGDLAKLVHAEDPALTLTDSAGASHIALLLALSPGQMNFVVPAAAVAGLATVSLTDAGHTIAAGVLRIERVAPGLFSANADGKGVAAAIALTVAADGSRSPQLVFDQAAAAGSRRGVAIDVNRPGEQVYLMLFGTGMRNASAGRASASVGGVEVGVAGPAAQGEYPGLDQVNLGPLPAALAGRGEVEILLSVEGKAANRVTVTIH